MLQGATCQFCNVLYSSLPADEDVESCD